MQSLLLCPLWTTSFRLSFSFPLPLHSAPFHTLKMMTLLPFSSILIPFILPHSLFWNIISLFFFCSSKRSHPNVSPFQLVRVLLCTTQIDFQPFYWILPQKGETISFGPFHFCLYKSKKIAVLEIIFFFRFEMKFFVFCVLCVLTLCVHADSSIEAVQGLVSRVIGAVFFSVFLVSIPSS